MTVAWLLTGVGLGIGFLVLARQAGPTGERRIWAAGLVIAALVYVGFAGAGGADSALLSIELLGLGAYGLAAWAGLRRSPLWLASGWALHAAWDVGLHLSGGGSSFAPRWYVVACLGFDLAAAAGIAWRSRAGRSSPV